MGEKMLCNMLSIQIQQLFAVYWRFSLFFVFFRFTPKILAFILSNSGKSLGQHICLFLEFPNQIQQKNYFYGAIATQDKISCLRLFPNNSNQIKPLSSSLRNQKPAVKNSLSQRSVRGGVLSLPAAEKRGWGCCVSPRSVGYKPNTKGN